MSTFSYFVDKLPAEVRVLTYGYIFGPCTHIKRVDAATHNRRPDTRLVLHDQSQDPTQTLLSTAILRTSKLVSAEALETLYKSKTVRLTFHQLSNDVSASYISRIRKLELVASVFYRVFFKTRPQLLLQWMQWDASQALKIASQLPQAKEVRILSDALAYIPSQEDVNPFISVRGWARRMDVGEVTCVDIGTYQLSKYPTIRIVNSKILRMWPEVASTPDDYNFLDHCEQVGADWRLGPAVKMVAWATQTSLRMFVALFEEFLAELQRDRDWDDWKVQIRGEQTEEVQRWLFQNALAASMLPTSQELPPGLDVLPPLHKVGAQTDPKILEFVTEFLAVNIESYYIWEKEELVLAKSYWPQIEGGEGIRAFRKRQAATSEGFPSQASENVSGREGEDRIGTYTRMIMGERVRIVDGDESAESIGEVGDLENEA